MGEFFNCYMLFFLWEGNIVLFVFSYENVIDYLAFVVCFIYGYIFGLKSLN